VSLTNELLPATRLQAGELQSFDFEYPVPPDAAPSMKLADNQIIWAVTCRIDIPSWPDWTATNEFVVDPKVFDPNEPPVVGSTQPEVEQGEGEWFDQVLTQLENSDDRQRLQLVLEAIREHEFPMVLSIEEDLDSVATRYMPETDGKWMYAYDERREIDLSLFVPHTLEAPLVETTWRGRIGIVDYSLEHGMLFAKMVASE
jgi:hypothetical protein